MFKYLSYYLLIGLITLFSQSGAPLISAAEEESEGSIGVTVEVESDADEPESASKDGEETIVVTADGDFFDDFGHHSGGDDDDDHGLSVDLDGKGGIKLFAIVVICAIVFLSPAIFLGVILYYFYRRRKLSHETSILLANKGVEVPPALLRPQRKDLQNGILLITGGVGVSALFQVFGDDLWRLGLLPIFLGIGYLIVWKLGEMKNRKARIASQISDLDIDK